MFSYLFKNIDVFNFAVCRVYSFYSQTMFRFSFSNSVSFKQHWHQNKQTRFRSYPNEKTTPKWLLIAIAAWQWKNSRSSLFVFVSEAAILVTSVTWCIPDMLWFVDVSFVGFKFTRHAVYHVRSEGPEQLHLFFPRVLMSPGTKTTGGKQN